jgi:rRNA-processing protein FCF1
MFGLSNNRSVFSSAHEQFHDYRPLVSKGIIRELVKLSSNKGNKGATARVALLEIKAKKINVDNISTYPDKWILDTASKRKDCIIVTNDTALAKRLRFAKENVYKISRSGILKRQK